MQNLISKNHILFSTDQVRNYLNTKKFDKLTPHFNYEKRASILEQAKTETIYHTGIIR